MCVSCDSSIIFWCIFWCRWCVRSWISTERFEPWVGCRVTRWVGEKNRPKRTQSNSRLAEINTNLFSAGKSSHTIWAFFKFQKIAQSSKSPNRCTIAQIWLPWLGTGLPDFSWYMIPKLEKCIIWTQNVPNVHKIHIPNGHKTYQNFPIQTLQVYQNWDFWLENKPSGNPWLGVFGRSESAVESMNLFFSFQAARSINAGPNWRNFVSTGVMIFLIVSPKDSAKKLAFLSKIAENCDHNIDPGFLISEGVQNVDIFSPLFRKFAHFNDLSFCKKMVYQFLINNLLCTYLKYTQGNKSRSSVNQLYVEQV
jgi:hypothetical protein